MALPSTISEALILFVLIAPLGLGLLLCWRPRDRTRQWLVGGLVAVALFAAFSPPAPGSGHVHSSGHAAEHGVEAATYAAPAASASQSAPDDSHMHDY